MSQSSDAIPLSRPEPPHAGKYRQAGYGFLVLGLAYLVLVYIFLPPFNLGSSAFVYAGLYAALMGVLAWFIFRGSRGLTLVLAVIYAARSLVSIYTLIKGEAFVAVPYVLPCLLATFYVLGRAVWDWP